MAENTAATETKVEGGIPSNWTDPLTPKPAVAAPSEIPASAVLPIPMGPYVLVIQDEAMHQIGNIFVPDTTMAPPLSGKVIRVSDGIRTMLTGELRPHDCKVDDIIYFDRFAGSDLTVNGRNYKILHGDDCKSRMPRKGEPQYEQLMAEREKREQTNRAAKEVKDSKPSPEQQQRLSRLGLDLEAK